MPGWSTAGIKRSVRRAGGAIGAVVSVRTDSPHVVLTYDDGPEPGGTEQILEVLAERGVRATFFVLLTRVRLYPNLLDEVVAAGHEIGLHGVDHRRLTSLRAAEVRGRMRIGKAELEDRCGRPVRWMRPPYGAQTPSICLAIRRAGMTPVLWGPSSWDWKPTTQEIRLTRIREGAGKGSILLYHDGFADARDGVTDGSPPGVDRRELATRSLDTLAELGLNAGSLGAALDAGSVVREARFRR
jgi:peptidoglycan/xylan/chitin deacetylase (PgdA/CDA1 family)